MAWTIDRSHSLVEFSTKHMMITTVRGRFDSFSGVLNIDPQKPEQSTVEGTIETASVDTRDAKRDAHLRSADFFDVDKYPVMKFRSTRIERAGSGEYRLVGDLTIKDVTREVTFDVSDEGQMKDPWGNTKWGLAARTTINRKDFGLNWNVALEAGGWLVAEQVNIVLEVELLQQVPAGAGVAVGAA